jgi:hypothetical protein
LDQFDHRLGDEVPHGAIEPELGLIRAMPPWVKDPLSR